MEKKEILKDNIHYIQNLYLSGKSSTDISKIFNCSTGAILYHLNKMNTKMRLSSQNNRKYTLNENFFDIIDNEEKSYFLGLLYADGYVHIKTNKIILQLDNKDKNILTKLNNIIQSNRPLTKIVVNSKFIHYRLSINNKHMVNELIKNGCGQKKTLTIRFPHDLPVNLLRHFIRGYFDGDGNIYIDKIKQPEFSLTGNFEFINECHNVLNKLLSLNPLTIQKNKNSFRVKYRGKLICHKIYNFLYDDSTIYFNRKYKIFKSLYS